MAKAFGGKVIDIMESGIGDMTIAELVGKKPIPPTAIVGPVWGALYAAEATDGVRYFGTKKELGKKLSKDEIKERAAKAKKYGHKVKPAKAKKSSSAKTKKVKKTKLSTKAKKLLKKKLLKKKSTKKTARSSSSRIKKLLKRRTIKKSMKRSRR